MEISANLSSSEFLRVANEIKKFKNETQDKIRLFISRLADKGVQAAYFYNSTAYAAYITFTKEDQQEGSIVVARETSLLVADWFGHEDVRINPLLMTEFGAGNYAVYWENHTRKKVKKRLDDGTRIGRGSFPNQKNAFKDQWFYLDKDKNLIATRGWVPSRPLHHAVLEMIIQIQTTAREVFRNGSN